MLVVLAAKKSVEIKDDEERRVRFKIRLMRELLKRGTSRDEVIGLLRFVDGIVQLSPDHERLVYEELHKEEEKAMPYVTNWERFAMEKGMEQGLQLGLQQGLQQSLQEALEERFGAISLGLAEQIRRKADQKGLQRLLRLAVRAGDLEEFEAHAGL